MYNTMIILLIFLAVTHISTACTTVGITPGASFAGRAMASQSNDGGATSDTRLFRVPATNHSLNSTRPVYAWTGGSYPRYVGSDRGSKNYMQEPGQKVSVPIGKIPQVPHTYAYFDGAFGLMNEHGLGLAESTCTSRVHGALPRPQGGALWYTDELSRMALERTTNARDAIQLMGMLAYNDGFYGEDNVEGTGESFIVVDKIEVWVFHVSPSDAQGTSAVWAAQRVPDGHVTVVPNIFVIRTMNLSDVDNYMGSPNIHDVALKNGWWDNTTEFDFTKAYSGGEYNHRYYSGRRWWGAMKLLVPEADFNDTYDNLRDDAPYPFSLSIKGSGSKRKNGGTGKKINVTDVQNVMRDFYEGTKYDMTLGLAAGSFGNPNRYDGELERPGQPGIKGAWERSISIYRTDYSHVIEIHPTLPPSIGATLWFGPVMAATTCYVPLLAGQETLLASYSRGHKGGPVNRESAMWSFRYVQQLANIRWDRMMVDITELQQMMHDKGVEDVQNMASKLPLSKRNGTTLAYIANGHAADVVKGWWALADFLMSKYADGNMYTDSTKYGPGHSKPAGYPIWWLKAVGYSNGPPPPLSDILMKSGRN